ncbi:MAG TPA: molybdopterin-synthase adenylyltransferase MoeB [Bacteroidia bacterium]|jgi:molybdopterin/thiamine biosynthesis adenylyltransferase/rhodanese-related sulfurtransferase|nr:molybdopterin-synthase adenylyltransferase MoeB [Bacteroidia bacterium]
MLSEKEKIRYARHLFLPEMGEEGQLKLKQAKVLVVGAGGLGCPVLQYLTAAGVGTVGIIDFDKVEESNLQRQILFSAEDVGKYKAEVAKEKLSKQNYHIDLVSHVAYLTSENAREVILQYDIVIDGSDNFATRYLVNDACVMLNKVLVFGSIFKFAGQVSVFNYKNGPTYRCLYPEPPAEGEVPNCSETGVLGVLPGICGTLMINEAIKIITGIGNVLSGELLSFDALTMQFNTFKVELNPVNKEIKKLIDYELFCGAASEISAQELKNKISAEENFQLIDVREKSEYDLKNIGGVLIPLNTLNENLEKLSPEKEIIVHCASGARSKKAAQLLREKGFKKVFNLKNGLLDF